MKKRVKRKSSVKARQNPYATRLPSAFWRATQKQHSQQQNYHDCFHPTASGSDVSLPLSLPLSQHQRPSSFFYLN